MEKTSWVMLKKLAAAADVSPERVLLDPPRQHARRQVALADEYMLLPVSHGILYGVQSDPARAGFVTRSYLYVYIYIYIDILRQAFKSDRIGPRGYLYIHTDSSSALGSSKKNGSCQSYRYSASGAPSRKSNCACWKTPYPQTLGI